MDGPREQPGVRWPDGFSEPVRRWFASSFDRPTGVQSRAWTTVSEGKNALVIAPTGSGKTLAAFLFAIDSILERKRACRLAEHPWARGVRILYVSPLKALGADVQRNLDVPLSAIAADAGAAAVTTAMRTGDTSPDERRKIVRTPPDILITTPESLYLMLTSQAREVLRTVQTVIVDEVHSIAGTKRGAHLSLSLERLDDLLEQPAQRIGLSATVRPREEVARFLGGTRPVAVVAEDAPPALDVSVRVPVDDMGAPPAYAPAGGYGGFRGKGDPLKARPMPSPDGNRTPDTRVGSVSIWPYIESDVLDLVLSHRSTIVFVNSRGLCERFTARLNELYSQRIGAPRARSESAGWWSDAGSASQLDAPAEPPAAAPAFRSSLGSSTEMGQGAEAVVAKAHHGSVAKGRRLEIERQLKAGELPCVVATSSLELGIDMGEVDLVVQIAPPPSVSSGLQRIGRANHQVGGKSAGIVFPKTRTELIDSAVMAQGMVRGDIEATHPVRNALDVLAQQTVATVSMAPDGMPASVWLATVRRSACFSDLGERSFESVLDMLAGRYESGDLAAFKPRILWDRTTGLLRPRDGSQRLAVGNAGTIPDRGMYAVVLPEGDGKGGRKRVGELDEEMVHESQVGDIVALGTSTWRIKEIGVDRVVVEPAPGRSARLPFWHGDTPSRPAETGYARGTFLREAAGALVSREDDDADGEGGFRAPFAERLVRIGFDERARANLANLLAAQTAATGALPTDKTLVVEQCQDETGDWRIILHSPFGRRVHEPWALAVGQRIRQLWGFDARAAAADDGIVVRVPLSAERVPGAELFLFDPDELDLSVRDSVGETSLFAARFRECAARALLTRPSVPGKRTPLWQQRLQGGQLLEAARQQGGFPLLAEATRECLTEAFDLPALRRVMTDLQTGRIAMTVAETAVPSPLAAALIFGYVGDHLYDGDMPHAERAASLLAVDQGLLSELLGEAGLNVEDFVGPQTARAVERDLQHLSDERKLRGRDGALDLLRELGSLTSAQVAERLEGAQAEACRTLPLLEEEHLAFRAAVGGETRWVAADDIPRLSEVLVLELPPWADDAKAPAGAKGADGALDGLLARFARTHAFWDEDRASAQIGVGPALVRQAAERLARAQRLVAAGPGRWVDSGVLKRLRTASLSAARAAVKPVSAEAFVSNLLDRQGVSAFRQAPQLAGIDGTAQVVSQFEGVYLPMALWEQVVLPSRVSDYRPAMLDDLLASGELLWAADGQHRVAFFPTDSPVCPLRLSALDRPDEIFEDEPGDRPKAGPDAEDAPGGLLRPTARALRRLLAERGPLTFPQMVEGMARAYPERRFAEEDVARALLALAHGKAATSDAGAFPRADAAELSDLERRDGDANPNGAYMQDAGDLGQQVPPSPFGQGSSGSGRRVSSRRGGVRYREAKAAARAHVVARNASRGRFAAALSGRWTALAPAEASSTLQALSLVDSLLDRYGVISRDIVLAAGVPGGMDALMPVLRPMEQAGELARGMFVEGLGPAQFAEKSEVEALRNAQAALDDSRRASTGEDAQPSLSVLEALDPANLFGIALDWPAVAWGSVEDVPAIDSLLPSSKPSRREGALTVVADGKPALWASPGLKHLLAFTDDLRLVANAIAALTAWQQSALKRLGAGGVRAKVLCETVNARPVLATPFAELLREAGFVRQPNGMRLYVNPF